MNTEIEKINWQMKGEKIKVHAMVLRANDFKPVETVAVYKCIKCHKKSVIYPEPKQLRKPRTCHYCDCKDLIQLLEESEYTDYQEIILTNINKGRKRIKAILLGEHILPDLTEGDYVTANATVKLKKYKKLIPYLMVNNIYVNKVSRLKPGALKAKKPGRNSKPTEYYKTWRSTVLEMDDYTCQKCNTKYGSDSRNLHIHHIDNYSMNEDLRLDPDNGITFCEDCHKRFHGIYGKTKNTRDQLDEFLHDWY